MVYDTFMFFNEFELLETRLEYLYPIVDKFIITECYINQAGNPKPMYFKENEHLFEKYKDKIIYNPILDVPNDMNIRTGNIVEDKIRDICSKYTHYDHSVKRYDNETYQKECILTKLNQLGLSDNDVIMFSDLDEIPELSYVESILVDVPYDNHINVRQHMIQYYLNVLKHEDWFGTRIFRWSYVKDLDIGLNGLRVGKPAGSCTNDKHGWHITFMGGTEKIKEKIRSYGHQEFNNDFILSNVEENVRNNRDIFYRPNQIYTNISMNFYPENFRTILENNCSMFIRL